MNWHDGESNPKILHCWFFVGIIFTKQFIGYGIIETLLNLDYFA